MLLSEEKYAIFISLSNDCQCQLIDKWQYCLIEKYGTQYSEYVWHNRRVAKDQTFLGEEMQIGKK